MLLQWTGGRHFIYENGVFFASRELGVCNILDALEMGQLAFMKEGFHVWLGKLLMMKQYS